MMALAPSPADRPPRYGLIIFLVGLAKFTITADFAVMTLALPLIARDLHIPPLGLSLVVAVEGVCYAGFLILGGRLTDLFGQRRCLIVGLTLFGAASACAGLAPSIWVLVATRAVQGLGAAILAPAAFSLLTTLIPQGPIRNRALGVYGIMQAMSVIMALLVGGVLANLWGWRAVFLINVPFVLTAIALGLALVPRGRPERAKAPLDWAGAVLITTAIALLLTSLSVIGRFGWSSPQGLGALAGAAVAFTAFVLVERRAADPLVPLGLLMQRSMICGCLGGLFVIASVGGLFVLSNLYMQNELHFSPLRSGIGMTGYAIAAMSAGFVAPVLLGRLPLRGMMALGFSLLTAGLVILTLARPEAGYFRGLAPGLALCGLGVATSWTAIMAQATTPVPPALQGVASGILFTFQQTGSPLGAAAALVIIATSGGLGGAEGFHALHAGYVGALVFAVIGLTLSLLLADGRKRVAAALDTAPSPVRTS